MLWLTEDARLVCKHELGIVSIEATQEWVTVESRKVLVDDNPEQRSISGCPNISVTIKPCNKTLRVQHGYSDLLRIDTKRVCLDSVRGLTDGTPPGTVEYKVRHAGQDLVSEAA
jgi:hypothetical protein